MAQAAAAAKRAPPSARHDEIPLADDDADAVIPENELIKQPAGNRDVNLNCHVTRFGPLQSTDRGGGVSIRGIKMASPLPKHMLNRNGALISPDELANSEERTALITQVLQLQSTLEDLSLRVDVVRNDSDKLRGENALLGQYICKLISASSAFKAVKVKDGGRVKAELSVPSASAASVNASGKQ